jgi:hypothetical protein
LRVVVFPGLSEDDRDGFLEVLRAVPLFQACVEEIVEAGEEDVEGLVQDPVGDAGLQAMPCRTSATLRCDTAAPLAEPFLPQV